MAEPNDATNDFTGTGTAPAPTLQAGSSTTLAPGESATFEATYVLTQADINAGTVSNSAVATGSSPNNTADVVDTSGTVAGTDTPTVTSIPSVPALTVSKILVNADDAEVDTLNEVIEYRIEVANTGNIDLTGVVLTDTISTGVTLATTGPAGDTTDPGVLNVGETWTYTASYTVLQGDLSAGADLVNTASVVTTEVTTPETNTAISTVAQISALTVSKTLVNADDAEVDTLNEVIEYRIEVANTGTTDLTGVNVTDSISSAGAIPLGAPSGNTVEPTVLNVGETWVYFVNYTVTSADLDDGSDLVNTASVATTELPTALVDTAISSVQGVDIEAIEEGTPV